MLGAKCLSYTPPTPYSFRGPPLFGRERLRLHDFPDTLPPGALRGAGEDIPDIPFDPVPRLRRRRKGWSEERQRDFIRALSKCASVAAAARSVGMTHMRFDGLDRSLNGSFVPVYRRGKLVQVEHRRNDRLAIAILGGRQTTADDLRRSAMSRREHRMDLAELDAAREVNKAAHKAADDALRAEVDRLVGRIEENRARRYGPRITRL
jgi:hypothetical protein